MCPWARFSGGEKLVCHVLLVESDTGLVLVDSGFGTHDMQEPRSRLGVARHVIKPVLEPAETAHAQVVARGFDPADVRHIVLTHLDLDHAGGLSDFPDARVHLLREEYRAGTSPPTLRERQRYQSAQWRHGPRWSPVDVAGEEWFGFPAVRSLDGLDERILLIPLVGHSRGHAGVAVDTGNGWVLHAGDAYYHRGQVPAPGSPAVEVPKLSLLVQRQIAFDDSQRAANTQRLAELATANSGTVRVFPAHDAVELDALRR